MILQSLNSYYQRLESESESDVAPYGFSREKISFCVVINAEGELTDVQDLRSERDGRLEPSRLKVPHPGGKRTSGVQPYFLWDKTAYLFGRDTKDETTGGEKKRKRLRKQFESFRQLHLDMENEIQHPEYSAVCRFLENWQPHQTEQAIPNWNEVSGTNLVFKLRNKDYWVHELPEVQNAWLRRVEGGNRNSEVMHCLVTGRRSQIARTHPAIKGVRDPGGQSEKSIVSFNLDAFNSYGKSQSLNSPVSEQAAFQYCTALNRLLASNDQRMQIGDATTVFWTEQPTPAETLLPWVFEPTRAEDDALKNKLHSILTRIASGQYPGEFGDADTPFYVLGLSPNAARISVRFWWVSTLGKLIENLRQHFVDLAIIHSERDPDFPAVWQLLRETVRDSKDLPPLLAGSVIRSILTGTPYPRLLFSSLLRRIRADRQVRYLRTATLKACLNRNSRLGIEPLDKELDMALDPDRSEPSYHLGRMFAELEKSQEDALPGINDTIKDRYFGSASATPAIVFPRLIRLNQHHLGKLDKGGRTFREKRIQAIADRINEFPSHLSLRDQGLFAIGYYHQRQNIFTKRSEAVNPQSEEQE